MSNSFNISLAPEVAAVKAVVDAIRAVDFPVTDALINAIGDLSDEQKSLLGVGSFTGIEDNFDTVANDADPQAALWTIVENGGSVNVENDHAGVPGYVKCDSGPATGNDGIFHSQDKKIFSLKYGVISVVLKTRFKFDFSPDAGITCGIGLCSNQLVVNDMGVLATVANQNASLVVSGGIPYAFVTDAVGQEAPNLSAYVSDDTWANLEMVVSAADVEFIINGTSRATLSGNNPNSVWKVVIGSTCFNNTNQYTYAENIKVIGI